MAQRTDPKRLAIELLAAGIPAEAFSGCRSGGPMLPVCWTVGHPTPSEQATADAVLAVHDPDIAGKEDSAERRRVRDLEILIDDAMAPLPQWRAAVAEHARILARRTGASRS